MASTAATERAITSRAGLDPTGCIVALARPRERQFELALRRLGRLAAGDAVPVLVAQRAGRVLGERVAAALPVRGPEERGDDFEVPVRDVEGLAPEVGEAEVDVELEQVDSGRALWHDEKRRKRVGRHRLREWVRSGTAPADCPRRRPSRR